MFPTDPSNLSGPPQGSLAASALEVLRWAVVDLLRFRTGLPFVQRNNVPLLLIDK